MKYKKNRNCPKCDKILEYSCSASYCLANRTNAKCRSCATKQYARRQNDLTKLLTNNYESLYWIGFILADGHISNNKRLVVTLANKDEQHLEKLCKFIQSPIKRGEQAHLSAMDSEIIPKIINKFNIHTNKTENPPKIEVFEKFTYRELLCIFAGFIDGDGNIKNLHKRKDFQLAIKCHSSWIEILSFFKKKFFPDSGYCKINNAGYSLFVCGNSTDLKKLKKEALELSIPILKRKWDIISLSYVSRQERAKSRLEEAITLLKNGENQEGVAKKLGMSSSGISLLLKRNKYYETR